MTIPLHRRWATRGALGGLAFMAGALLVAARPLPPIKTLPAAEGARATGVTFNYRVTSTAEDKRRREAASMFTTVRMQDGNIRMDYVEGVSPLGNKGGYVIIQGNTQKFIVVDPKEKKAMMMTADGFGSGVGALMNNPMLKMTISNTSFRFKDMGAGETILGYKTRKVRTWYTSTMELKAMMMPDQKVVTNDSSDQWIATIDFGQGSFEQWAKSFGAGVKSTNPELAAQLQEYNTTYGKSGLALKSVTWSSQTDKKGKVTNDQLTMEVTDLKSGSIDASMFEVPKGYEVVDMTQLMADAKASMDSAKAESGKGEKPKEEEKTSGKDALKKGLGGLLKKKPPV
ncbi:MAG: DUF4412 domain-containing protein [Gemmatimonadaceae bacterium]|nr:DUF4412 domain-containing protein [Gemmatimonadaceae bacterium]